MLIITALIVAAFTIPGAEAQGTTNVRPGGRGGNWEIFLPLTFTDSTTIKGQGGSSVDINADWGFGFGLGYNVNDNFQVNGAFTWGYRSYNATIVQSDGATRKYSNFMDTSTLSLNGVYYFRNTDITPFVSGGVGVTYVDTNIQNGASSTYCYWDPWWGYICGGYVPTKAENEISYNAGVGVRFDVNRQFGLQAGYYRTWIDFSKASGTSAFDILRLDLIFRM